MLLKKLIARSTRRPASYLLFATTLLGVPTELRAQTTQTPPAFTCTAGTAYLFQKDVTDAYELNLRTGTLTQRTFNGIVLSDGTQGGKYNAFGFNPRDSYIWGQVYNDSKIIRVAGNFSGQVFPVTNLPAKPFVVGDISNDGIMYLAIGGSNATDVIYAIDLKVDLTKTTYSATPISTTLTYITDWGVSPKDGNLYAVSSNVAGQTGAPVLYRFLTAPRTNPATGTTAASTTPAGTRETLGTLTGGSPAIASSNFGSAFMDVNGSFYVVTNDKGIIYRIDNPHQLPVNGSPTVTYVGQPSASPNASNTDGARCATSAVPLPVELVAFTATAAPSRTVALNWATASEMHNAYFEVQRSSDGRTFEVAGRVQGHGSTLLASTYQFTDTAPGALPAAYYRLRQVDTDGSFSFSPVRTVALGSGSSPLRLVVAPNPAPAGQLHLQVSNASAAPTAATLTLTDLLGRRLHTQAVTLPPGTTDVGLQAPVAPGAYWLLLNESEGQARQSVRVLITD